MAKEKVELFVSAKNGWFCGAKYNKKKGTISWHLEEDNETSNLSKQDLEIIKTALIAKSGKLYKCFDKVDIDSLIIRKTKEKKFI